MSFLHSRVQILSENNKESDFDQKSTVKIPISSSLDSEEISSNHKLKTQEQEQQKQQELSHVTKENILPNLVSTNNNTLVPVLGNIVGNAQRHKKLAAFGIGYNVQEKMQEKELAALKVKEEEELNQKRELEAFLMFEEWKCIIKRAKLRTETTA